MATQSNIDRATLIVSGMLGKNPTQEQVIKAVDSVWAISGGAELTEGDDPEARAGFFCEIVKKYVGMQVQKHANNLAQAQYQDDINSAAGDYTGDFTGESPEPMRTKK